MKNRLLNKEYKKLHTNRSHFITSVLFPIIAFVFVFGLFFYGINTATSSSNAASLDSLKTALSHDILHCYASTGAYPKDLNQIEEDYGLTYNKENIHISYTYLGPNTYPDYEISLKEVTKDE